MNEQERQVISDIFRRLESVANQPRETEAERYIAEMIRRQPYAPYAMAQAIFVQEQAVTNLNEQVQQLQAELERAQSQGSSGGGLLSSIFGGGSRPEPEPRRGSSYSEAQGGPWGRTGGSVPQAGGYGGQPSYGAPQGGPFGGQPGGFGGRGGGGFLQTAMATAVGAAGGMMLGSALANAFDGKDGGHETGGGLGALASGESGSEGGSEGGSGGITDSLYQNASNEDPGEDFGGDAGDDGDWT